MCLQEGAQRGRPNLTSQKDACDRGRLLCIPHELGVKRLAPQTGEDMMMKMSARAQLMNPVLLVFLDILAAPGAGLEYAGASESKPKGGRRALLSITNARQARGVGGIFFLCDIHVCLFVDR